MFPAYDNIRSEREFRDTFGPMLGMDAEVSRWATEHSLWLAMAHVVTGARNILEPFVGISFFLVDNCSDGKTLLFMHLVTHMENQEEYQVRGAQFMGYFVSVVTPLIGGDAVFGIYNYNHRTLLNQLFAVHSPNFRLHGDPPPPQAEPKEEPKTALSGVDDNWIPEALNFQ